MVFYMRSSIYPARWCNLCHVITWLHRLGRSVRARSQKQTFVTLTLLNSVSASYMY